MNNVDIRNNTNNQTVRLLNSVYKITYDKAQKGGTEKRYEKY